MMNIILGGVLLGSIVFLFSYIASKKNGKYYLAPVVTFLVSLAITAYGFLEVRGFEGMGYGLLGAGFLIVSIVGTLLLPFLSRQKDSKLLKKKDKISLVMLPVLFFTIIGLTIYLEQEYWIIEQGVTTYVEEGRRAELDNFYEISTISEGNKQVALILGKDFVGKEIEVEKVSKRGPTEITVNIVNGDAEDKSPYITIGLDQINEPLTVQTSNGVVFESVMDQLVE